MGALCPASGSKLKIFLPEQELDQQQVLHAKRRVGHQRGIKPPLSTTSACKGSDNC